MLSSIKTIFQIFVAFLGYLKFTDSNLQHFQMSLSKILRNFHWIFSWHHPSLTRISMVSTKEGHTPFVICIRPKVPMRQSKLLRKTEVGFFYENLPKIVSAWSNWDNNHCFFIEDGPEWTKVHLSLKYTHCLYMDFRDLPTEYYFSRYRFFSTIGIGIGRRF